MASVSNREIVDGVQPSPSGHKAAPVFQVILQAAGTETKEGEPRLVNRTELADLLEKLAQGLRSDLQLSFVRLAVEMPAVVAASAPSAALLAKLPYIRSLRERALAARLNAETLKTVPKKCLALVDPLIAEGK